MAVAIVGCGSPSEEPAPTEEASPPPAARDSVSALGRLEPEGGIVRISAPSTPEAITGVVLREVLVEQGERVEAGQLLAVTDTAQVMEAKRREAEAQRELALREAEAEKSRAEEACVRAAVARKEAGRRADLVRQGVVSEEESESALADADAKEASCAAAEIASRVAEASAQVAASHVERIEAERQRAYVRSPISAVVLEVLAHPGELVLTDGIVELGRVERMMAIAEVFETEIDRVRPGQQATIRSEAFEGPLSGRVERIRPKVQKQDEIGTDPAARKDARIVEVEIRLDDPESAANFTNLQVEVVIET